MAFSDQQTRQLKAKLDAQHVKKRKADGATLHYIEGWHAIAEANRIFGFDGWDRRTLMTNCIWTATAGDLHLAAYVAKVKAQADSLVAQRYMLPADAARIVTEAEAAKFP